jgi:hypothetical protein
MSMMQERRFQLRLHVTRSQKTTFNINIVGMKTRLHCTERHRLVKHQQWGNILSMFTSYVTDRQRSAQSQTEMCVWQNVCIPHCSVPMCDSQYRRSSDCPLPGCHCAEKGMGLCSWNRHSRSYHTQNVKVVEKLVIGL